MSVSTSSVWDSPPGRTQARDDFFAVQTVMWNTYHEEPMISYVYRSAGQFSYKKPLVLLRQAC